ncbi:hypothetical protein QVD17_21472 [Tagetes erecta]|uniref:BHLH domain-containing protein n=1 Tax=Tagetes erecta TaxID=13708 RepID=A0AAD8KF21_TARER|nr:hypothetical protein QVD17_21472 [Tagetes erecta]
MNQRVPSWDLEDVNPNHDIYKLDYEVAELTWENGQLALHELGSRRVPTKSQPTTSWEQPRATETLEALVNQATLQPYCKTEVAVNDDEHVPWMHHHNATVYVDNLNEPPTITSDALVPSTNNRTGEKSAQPSINACCSTRVSSCSGNPSAFRDPPVARGGGVANEVHNCRDMSMSGTFVTCDLSAGDGRLTSTTSMGSPEHTSSGRDLSNSTFADHTASHRRTQRQTNAGNEKKTEKAKSSVLNKRRRTAANHNQSERRRRDNINQKLKTLQKLVPNSSKTDKASMLEEVIEHVKQLQLQLHSVNMMNMSPMMMSFAMQQQQLQLQKSMMNPMGIGMGMGMGMGIGTGMGGMDMNSIGTSTIPTRFHPSAFMPMPSWNNQTANIATMAGGPMSAFLAPRCQPPNMDSYSRMAALYQQMQNQPCGSFPKN